MSSLPHRPQTTGAPPRSVHAVSPNPRSPRIRSVAAPVVTRRLGIAVPTYNERDSLPLLLAALEAAVGALDGVDVTLLVIDDNSPDGTGELAEQLAEQVSIDNLSVSVLHRQAKEGLGRAYVAGLLELLEDPTLDYVLQMDADLSHDPGYIGEFLDRARTADLVVGSRYVPGGSTPDWAWYRKLVSRGGNLYARVFLGSQVTDYTGGFNLYSAELLRSVDLAGLRADGYGFLIELKCSAMAAADTTAQVPISFVDRRVGTSKIPANTAVKTLLLVPRIWLVRRLRLGSAAVRR